MDQRPGCCGSPSAGSGKPGPPLRIVRQL